MASREKVMLLIKGLGLGGAERLLATAIPYLNRDAFDYEVAYLLVHKNDLVPEFERANIPIFCLNLKIAFDPRGPYRLWRLLRDRRPRILHLHLPYTGILGRIIGRLAGVKVIVYTEHSVMGVYHPLTRLFNLLTYPLNRTTIAVSEEVQHSILKYRISNGSKLLVIHNGVEPNNKSGDEVYLKKLKKAMGIPAAHRVVGSVGHIRPEKGQEYLLRAAKFVVDRCPRVTFVIVGREKENGETRRLEDLAATLGIRKNIIFTGFRPDAIDLMSIFDLFVLSSLYEGLPVALLEAMALGKPSVATSVGGIPEVIDNGLDGFLVKPKDPEELAAKIITLLEIPDLRRRMSKMAKQKIREKFSLQDMIRSIEGVYSTLRNGSAE